MQPQEGTQWIGRTIDGRYLVDSVLGKGGMGVVLRVRHKYTGQHAALKLLHPHLRMHGDLAARFLAEARAPAAIGHPGIVTVVDAGFSPEGELYLVMELLQGMTLAAAMKAQPLPFAAIRRVGLEMLAALGAAHAAGFIHRDLKPENVFLADPGGTVKLLDFGIAKVLDEGLGARGETQTGMVMGTVAYMSPEQLRDSRNVDLRTDLWAAGVMIYELATGRLPYASETLGNLLVAMMSQAPRPLGEALAEVPPALDVFLRRALAVDVHQRFTSAAEMAAVLNSMHVLGLARRGQPVVLPAGAKVPLAAPVPPPVVAAPAQAPAAYVPAAPSVAPRAPAPASVPPPLSQVSPPSSPAAVPPSQIQKALVSVPPAPSAAAPPRSRTAMYVAIAALVAAVGLAVALVIVLKDRQAPPAGAATATSDAAVTPTPVPTPVPTPPPDAAPAPADAAAPPAPRAKKASARELCAAACATSQKKCGVTYLAPCVDTCLGYPPETINACLPAAGDDCNQVGACGFVAICGTPPQGHASCRDTAGCMIRCGQDVACTCQCARAMALPKTNLFLRFASCTIAHCARECSLDASMCLTCVNAHCAASAAACMAQ